MATTFSECPKAVYDYLNRVYRNEHRARLTVKPQSGDKIEPTIKALFQHGSPLKHHGYAAAAVIKITSLKERAAGAHDVLLVIDQDSWNRHGDAQREALLDHELEHLELRPVPEPKLNKKTGKPRKQNKPPSQLDDLGRPKLKMRRHDFEIGGFDSIIERHGETALEAMQVGVVAGRHKQMLIPWMEGRDALRATGTDDAPASASTPLRAVPHTKKTGSNGAGTKKKTTKKTPAGAKA